MNRLSIKTFFIKDIKLIEKKRLILFLLFVVIWYYFYTNFLLQTDVNNNVYLLGAGYQPKEIIDTSIIGMLTSLLFFVGITSVDLNDKISIGYSLVATKINVTNMIIARVIFCILCLLLTLLPITLYFTYIGYELKYILAVSFNAILFTFNTYMALAYLISKRKIELMLSSIVILSVIYMPLFMSLRTLTIFNIIYLISTLLFVFIFSEKIYRNKLKDSLHVNNHGNYLYSFIMFNIDNYLEIFSVKAYNIISKKFPKSHTKYLSLLYLDIQRYFKFSKRIFPILILQIIFKSEVLILTLIIFTFYGSMISLQIKNFKSDYWVCNTNLMSNLGYVVYKIITFLFLNLIFTLIIIVVSTSI